MQGARNIVHTKPPHHPTEASAVTIQNINSTQRQSSSFAMAADATMSTNDNAPIQRLNYLHKITAANPFITEKGAPT